MSTKKTVFYFLSFVVVLIVIFFFLLLGKRSYLPAIQAYPTPTPEEIPGVINPTDAYLQDLYTKQQNETWPTEAPIHEKNARLGDLMEKLPHTESTFSFYYDYNKLVFVLSLDTSNETQGMKDFAAYLNKNGISKVSDIPDLSIKYETIQQPTSEVPQVRSVTQNDINSDPTLKKLASKLPHRENTFLIYYGNGYFNLLIDKNKTAQAYEDFSKFLESIGFSPTNWEKTVRITQVNTVPAAPTLAP